MFTRKIKSVSALQRLSGGDKTTVRRQPRRDRVLHQHDQLNYGMLPAQEPPLEIAMGDPRPRVTGQEMAEVNLMSKQEHPQHASTYIRAMRAGEDEAQRVPVAGQPLQYPLEVDRLRDRHPVLRLTFPTALGHHNSNNRNALVPLSLEIPPSHYHVDSMSQLTATSYLSMISTWKLRHRHERMSKICNYLQRILQLLLVPEIYTRFHYLSSLLTRPQQWMSWTSSP